MQIGLFAFTKNNADKILLVQDATREEKWTMPGGGLDFQEIVTNGMKREIKEEIGVDAKVKNLLGVFSQQKTSGIVLLFECTLESQEFILDKNEVQNIKYFSVSEIEENKGKIKPAQYSMIKQVLDNKGLPIFSNFSLE
jgi:8-oxo-dGTP diphosphatase